MFRNQQSTKLVFPMYVGVILRSSPCVTIRWGIPHVCGGDPRHFPVGDWKRRVFPMYVGVILLVVTCFNV